MELTIQMELTALKWYFSFLFQAVDSNSLKKALETWFDGLDVDRDGIFIF